MSALILAGLCPHCETRFSGSAINVPDFCAKCGTKTITKCKNEKCGKNLADFKNYTAKFCESCGTSLML